MSADLEQIRQAGGWFAPQPAHRAEIIAPAGTSPVVALGVFTLTLAVMAAVVVLAAIGGQLVVGIAVGAAAVLTGHLLRCWRDAARGGFG